MHHRKQRVLPPVLQIRYKAVTGYSRGLCYAVMCDQVFVETDLSDLTVGKDCYPVAETAEGKTVGNIYGGSIAGDGENFLKHMTNFGGLSILGCPKLFCSPRESPLD